MIKTMSPKEARDLRAREAITATRLIAALKMLTNPDDTVIRIQTGGKSGPCRQVTLTEKGIVVLK